jgi:DNA-binding NtrC family response regulator
MASLIKKKARQRILVVDSDMAAAEVLAIVVENVSECEVVSACSGFEGIQKIGNGVVNIVFAAEKLVDMSGMTFINIMKSLKKSKIKEPVCVLMAETGKRKKTTEVDHAGSFDVIRSTVDPDEFANTLSRALDWDRMNWRIGFNELVWKVLLVFVPVAVLVGVVIGAI